MLSRANIVHTHPHITLDLPQNHIYPPFYLSAIQVRTPYAVPHTINTQPHWTTHRTILRTQRPKTSPATNWTSYFTTIVCRSRMHRFPRLSFLSALATTTCGSEREITNPQKGNKARILPAPKDYTFFIRPMQKYPPFTDTQFTCPELQP